MNKNIIEQQNLLKKRRNHLSIILHKNIYQGGSINASIEVINSVKMEYKEIYYIKKYLLEKGVVVEDHPIDETALRLLEAYSVDPFEEHIVASEVLNPVIKENIQDVNLKRSVYIVNVLYRVFVPIVLVVFGVILIFVYNNQSKQSEIAQSSLTSSTPPTSAALAANTTSESAPTQVPTAVIVAQVSATQAATPAPTQAIATAVPPTSASAQQTAFPEPPQITELKIGKANTDEPLESEVCVPENTSVNISADGVVVMGPYVGPSDPDGKDNFLLFGADTPIDKRYYSLPEFQHGTLLCRIGEEADWQQCGSAKTITASSAGCVQLAINDSLASDNSGSYSVRIEVLQ